MWFSDGKLAVSPLVHCTRLVMQLWRRNTSTAQFKNQPGKDQPQSCWLIGVCVVCVVRWERRGAGRVAGRRRRRFRGAVRGGGRGRRCSGPDASRYRGAVLSQCMHVAVQQRQQRSRARVCTCTTLTRTRTCAQCRPQEVAVRTARHSAHNA
jgi:hypothetical protein